MTFQIIIGDALEELRKMPGESVDCCITSPPYWGLRDYGVEGQLGLEPTLAKHISALVEIFEEVSRILKPHGTLWLNYGDCYATSPNGRSAEETKQAGNDDRTFRDKPFSTVQGSLKPKDLCMIPNRLAIALQDAGWWVRSEIIWGKSNPMPDSSGAYRPSAAHEKIFLLTKSGDAPVFRARDSGEIRFDPDLSETCPLVTDPSRKGPRWLRLGSFYDAEAVRMPVSENTHMRLSQDVANQIGSARANGGGKVNGNMKAVGRNFDPGANNRNNPSFDAAMQLPPTARYLRNFEPDLSQFHDHIGPDVWQIATAAYTEAHFATFPPALVVPCVMGGCPKGGTVLDPFGGSGTTALVAQALQRDAILIELNPEYAAMAEARIKRGSLKTRMTKRADTDHDDLFGEVAA